MLAPGTEWQNIAIAAGLYIVSIAAVTVIGYMAAVRRQKRAECEAARRTTQSPSRTAHEAFDGTSEAAYKQGLAQGLEDARRAARDRGYQTHTVDGQEYATFPDGHTTPVGPGLRRLTATIDSEIAAVERMTAMARQERAARKAELVATLRMESPRGELMTLPDYVWARRKGVLPTNTRYGLTFDPAPSYDPDEWDLLTEVLREARQQMEDLNA